MVAQIAIDTLVIPLALGVLVFFAGRFNSAALSRVFVFGLLLAAAIAYVNLESLPAFPPVSSKDKMPYILIIGAVVFALWPRSLFRDKVWFNWLVLAIVSALPVLWIGINVIARKPMEASVALAALLLISFASALYGKSELQLGRSLRVAQLASVAWSLTGLALVCAFGAYVGMAQVSGAAAAMVGISAALLVGLSFSRRWLQTSVSANVIYGAGALIIVYAAVTALFARHASLAAIVLVALCPLVPPLLAKFNAKALNGDGAVAHLAASIISGIPAIVAAVVAALTFISNQ